MTQDKNPKSKMEGHGHASQNEDYMFMKAVIKEPPRKKRRILLKILGILVSGVAVGVIAALTFVHVLPYIQPEEDLPKVEFPDDDYIDSEHIDSDSQNANASNSTDNEQNSEPGKNPPNPSKDDGEMDCPEQLTLDGFRQVYEEIVEVAEQSEKAMVIVQGITREVDWMNNSYENKTQVSGVLVAEDSINYYVLTEYRVVEQVERIMVTFSNESIALAKFVKHDPGTGLAVLKISKNDVSEKTKGEIAVAVLGSSWTIKRGETVIAIGSPTGYSGSIAYGMVTSTNNVKATTDTQYHLLTTDILGDSEGSGVLISLDGEIVGVMVQSFSMEKNQNVLTAIPISEVKKVIENLINNEDLIYLGIVGQNITEDLSENTDIPVGVYVNAVEEDSPAMSAGIQNGDVIVGIADETIETLQQLKANLNKYEKGNKITVNALRRGAADRYVQIVFDVTVGAL